MSNASDFGRILGLLAASIEGRLSSISEVERQHRLTELCFLLKKAPLETLSSTDSFPAVSYVLNVILSVISGPNRPELRIEAADALQIVLKRHPSNDFLSTVLPGVCTAILKFLSSWEKEPAKVVIKTLKCLSVLLERTLQRVAQEGKLETVLNRISALAVSMSRSVKVAKVYLELLMTLIENLPSEDKGLPLGRAIALIVSVVDIEKNPTLLRVATMTLDNSMEQLSETSPENVTELQVQVVAGLCSILPIDLWPENVTTECVAMALYAAEKSKLMLSNTVWMNMPISEWCWQADDFRRGIVRILRLFGRSNLEIVFNDDLFDGAKLLCWGQVLCGLESPTAIESAIDTLVVLFEDFASRSIEKEWEGLQNEELYWHLCWCSAVSALVSISVSGSSLEYFVWPLLSLCSAHNIQLQDAAKSILDSITKKTGFPRVDDLVKDQLPMLLGRLASDLRYPLLYPRAPLVLAEIVPLVENTAMIVDTLRELEARAAEYQTFPAYSLLLLRAMERCALVSTLTFTLKPNDPKDKGEGGEEGEGALNEPMTVEEELSAMILQTAIHFVTCNEERVRLAALGVLLAATKVFKQERSSVFLPLAHHTWKPLLARLGDPCLEVARLALKTISIQAGIAGQFLRDRIQKELWPVVGGLLSREGATVSRDTSISIILELLGRMGKASSEVIRSTTHVLISLCGEGILTIGVTLRMLRELATVDADQVWFVLAVQLSPNMRVLQRDGLPSLDLVQWKLTNSNFSRVQEEAISQSLHSIYSQCGIENNLY
jgi:hypothetical protein